MNEIYREIPKISDVESENFRKDLLLQRQVILLRDIERELISRARIPHKSHYESDPNDFVGKFLSEKTKNRSRALATMEHLRGTFLEKISGMLEITGIASLSQEERAALQEAINVGNADIFSLITSLEHARSLLRKNAVLAKAVN